MRGQHDWAFKIMGDQGIRTSFLSPLSMWVLFAANHDRVYHEKQCQDSSERALYDDQDYACDRFRGLGEAELFNEDQDTDDGKHSDDLDDAVDPVA